VKRLLVVANPFPPMASAGTTRVLRFLRHLPDHGWETTVLTAEAHGPSPTPEFVRVVRTPTLAPRALREGGRRARLTGWVFVPDPYAPWIPTAVAAGRRLLAAEPFDAVFSSHPRASAHVVAACLASRGGPPWLADYRDRRFANEVRPYPSAAHAAAMRRLEAHVLRRAAAVSAINRPILDDLVAHSPWLADRGHVLPNGYDEREPAAPVELGPGFWIVYTGRLYRRERVLEAFLRALAELPEDVKALFVGDAPRVEAQAERLGVAHRVRVEPLVPHDVALGYQRAADVLLLVTHERPESMSSKVFEYLRSGRPVFALTGPETAAARVLRDVGGAVAVAHDGEIAAELAGLVAAVRSGSAPAADAAALARYDVTTVTTELAAILDRLAAGGHR